MIQCSDYQIIKEPICGEINKMAPVRFSYPTLSCPLTPCSVNSNFVTAEITYSIVLACHEVLSWPQATFVWKAYISFN